MENKWLFVHIPKTGGTTIINYLKEFLDNKIIHSDKNKIAKSQQKYVIFGHLDPDLYEDREKIVWIRDPVSRVISNYNHLKWRIENNSGNYIIIDNKVMFFDNNVDIIEFTKETVDVFKYFTKYDSNIFKYIGIFENFNESFKQTCKILKLPYKPKLIGHYRKQQKLKSLIVTKEQINEIKQILKRDIEFYNSITSKRINDDN